MSAGEKKLEDVVGKDNFKPVYLKDPIHENAIRFLGHTAYEH